MTLSFVGDIGKRHFEFCFVGFILGGSMQDRKGVALLRRELVLFDKLESISELKPCGKKMPNNEPERQLMQDAQLEIDLSEFDLLHAYISATPWQTGTPTRHALETLDWLEAEARAQTASSPNIHG